MLPSSRFLCCTCLCSMLRSIAEQETCRRRLLSQLIFAAKRQGRPVQMLTSDTEFYSLTRQVLALPSPVGTPTFQKHPLPVFT